MRDLEQSRAEAAEMQERLFGFEAERRKLEAISPKSRPDLPQISPTSRPHLAHISPYLPVYLQARLDQLEQEKRRSDPYP